MKKLISILVGITMIFPATTVFANPGEMNSTTKEKLVKQESSENKTSPEHKRVYGEIEQGYMEELPTSPKTKKQAKTTKYHVCVYGPDNQIILQKECSLGETVQIPTLNPLTIPEGYKFEGWHGISIYQGNSIGTFSGIVGNSFKVGHTNILVLPRLQEIRPRTVQLPTTIAPSEESKKMTDELRQLIMEDRRMGRV